MLRTRGTCQEQYLHKRQYMPPTPKASAPQQQQSDDSSETLEVGPPPEPTPELQRKWKAVYEEHKRQWEGRGRE